MKKIIFILLITVATLSAKNSNAQVKPAVFISPQAKLMVNITQTKPLLLIKPQDVSLGYPEKFDDELFNRNPRAAGSGNGSKNGSNNNKKNNKSNTHTPPPPPPINPPPPTDPPFQWFPPGNGNGWNIGRWNF
jgi:hypothetical protein